MRTPDFIIGGAPRSGTTWLYAALDQHPGVHMAKPVTPEPKFFLVDELYEQGFDSYCNRWFAQAPAGTVAGEKSTNYLESPVAAQRIFTNLPQARLIFLLREPVDRAFNNWLWSRHNGVETESFETALTMEEERERTCSPPLRYARPHALFSRGLYADLLRPYFELFPREQILVLRFEDIATAPRQVLASTHAFLGVEQRPADAERLGVINRANGELEQTIPEHLRQRLQAAYEEPNRQLAALLGGSFHLWGTK